MDKTQKMWNDRYGKLDNTAPKLDGWLDKYLDILKNSNDIPILDLGCGYGNDSFYLTKKGLPVLSCDYCQNALDRLQYFIEQPNTMHLDMREPLPFYDSSFKVIISDLTLHYFDDSTTKGIIRELYRVQQIGGIVICRVNSTNELASEAHTPIRIDNNFYRVGKKEKRYFDSHDAKHYFKDFTVDNLSSYIMHRYRDPKYVLEFSATKK